MKGYTIRNATIINEGEIFTGSVYIYNGIIRKIFRGELPDSVLQSSEVIDGEGRWCIPGIIDDHVHFREPGLTHKADIRSESSAAVAGGITSFMEMPNTDPPATSLSVLEEKYAIAGQNSLANYSFYLGATNDNLDEILRCDPSRVCGIKVFMGSSTGNMLVDDVHILNEIFSRSSMLIAVHCEDEDTIRNNIRMYRDKYGENLPVEYHPLIRNADACFKSSSLATELAQK
ncbi:MAG: amidohydrolase family protein, partial [Bacteroidetes bacterium]|nr:amidohydrolase family protein [Bacteroidota bacterium]